MKKRTLAILETAELCFKEKGFKATSMQGIADACGISKGAIYLHFRSKSDLLLAILEKLDDHIKKAILALQAREDMSAKEKFKAQILYQFDEVMNNRELNQMLLQDADVYLDQELYLFAQKCRYSWQQLQMDFLGAIYHDSVGDHLIDLSVMVNGLINEYYSFILLEGIDLSTEKVADFLVDLTDQWVRHLQKNPRSPIITPGLLPNPETLDRQFQQLAQEKAQLAFKTLQTQAEQLDLDAGARSELEATLSLMETELEKDASNKVLLQALLANLREYKPLLEARKTLAHELKVRLV